MSLNRNWSELPGDLTLMILLKLSAVEILESAQFVCKMWYILCKEPSMWRTIHIKYTAPEVWHRDEKKTMLKYEKMTLNAIDRSDGSLIDLSIENFGGNDICSYFASRAPAPGGSSPRLDEEGMLEAVPLRHWGPRSPSPIADSSLVEGLEDEDDADVNDDGDERAPVGGGRMAISDHERALESLSCLEELELTLCDFIYEDENLTVDCCPSLITFKLNKLGSKCPDMACDYEALAIAGNMPELRHLQLIGNGLTDVGLTAILDGCPHLQSLDLRACFHIELVGNLGNRLLEQIKDLWCPYDSTHDYNYVSRYENLIYSDEETYEESD
ncbi:putative F-box/LRR-repeat protein 9 [Silene latifolia]|uniref:putative F-box/LRR-repeat protein 9 n=1 Tax=Silene latifolia TaxID=37657 RepID=UPI003D78704E